MMRLVSCLLFSTLSLSLSLRNVRDEPQYVALRGRGLPEECEEWKKYKKQLKKIPKCGSKKVDSGDICRGGKKKTGTSSNLNNCGSFDLYRFEDALEDEFEEEEEENTPTRRPTSRPTASQSTKRPTPRPTPRPIQSPAGSFKFPEYSQQCRDDAGPAIEDDEEIYGRRNKYHSSSKALAVLKQGGKCAQPVAGACRARGAGNGAVSNDIARAAYLEGPISCGNKGWFCRILPDENHGGGDQSDWNYNHCNRTRYGDTDGHCHGSDTDNTYYWWVRDHWHRNYAGRLHCCCDWEGVKDVVSQCDYRAPLQPGENKKCRDANEDHNGPGSGFSKGYGDGCSNLGTNRPLPEPAEKQCWDVLNFAPGGRD